MLIWIAIGLGTAALIVLAFSVTIGFPIVLAVKSLVDTSWAVAIVGGLKFTEVFSVAVACIAASTMAFSSGGRHALRKMPLKFMWFVYVFDICLFSSIASLGDDPMVGLNMFFRHINGFVGFYIAQGFFSNERGVKAFLLGLVLAGIFPIGVGLLEIGGVIHVQWMQTKQEGLDRYIGFYHDAITSRYYAEQTMLAVLLFSAMYLKELKHSFSASLLGALGLFALIVMYKTYSKSAMVTLGLWIVEWTILRRKFGLLLMLGTLGLMASGYFADKILDEVYLVFHKEVGAINGSVGLDRTLTGRWYVWEELVQRWSSESDVQKLLGSGQLAVGAHNDYLQILYHGGMVGLTLYLCLLGTVAVKIARVVVSNPNPLNVGALMALTMWMVDTIGLVPSAYSGYQWFVWGVIGLALGVERHSAARRTVGRGRASSLLLGLSSQGQFDAGVDRGFTKNGDIIRSSYAVAEE